MSERDKSIGRSSGYSGVPAAKPYAPTEKKVDHLKETKTLTDEIKKIEKVEFEKLLKPGEIDEIKPADLIFQNYIVPKISKIIDDKIMLPTNFYLKRKENDDDIFKYSFRNEIGKKFSKSLRIESFSDNKNKT